MRVYDVSLLLKMQLEAAHPDEAEEVLAILVKSLESLGAEVTIEGFDTQQDGASLSGQ